MHLPCCALIFLRTPAVLTLLCSYFPLRLPCCDLIFLRTYPAVLFFFFRTYSAVPLSRFSITNLTTSCDLIFLRTTCCAIIFFGNLPCCVLIPLFDYNLPCCDLVFLRTYPAALTLIFLRTYPARRLSRFTITNYPAVPLIFYELTLLRSYFSATNPGAKGVLTLAGQPQERSPLMLARARNY